jgi:hypothetical protein
MFSFTITHTMGWETVTIEASSPEQAYAKALNWALLEGLLVLRCTRC